jgi:energy-coupling factor transporter ATP-binding protein EcfA2
MADPIVQALARCSPNEALEPGDPRFVDFDDLRGLALRTNIQKLFSAAEASQTNAKIIVAGHRGSGKSTELNRVQKLLEESGYDTLWASVNDNLDPNDLSFSDVMRLIVSLLDDRYGERTKQDPQLAKAFANVADWFREVTRTHSQQIQDAKDFGLRGALGGKLGARVGGEAGAPGAKGGIQIRTELGELAASINVIRRSETTDNTQIKETLERYPSQLVDNINLLLRSVGARRIAIILDNVDKYKPELVNEAFLRQSGLFQALECHLIFTVQSSMQYRPVEDAIEESFQVLEIPMLPVFHSRTRRPEPGVVKRVREAVYKRVEPELFASGDGAVDELIAASGGCWRDLLRLLNEALLNAGTRIEEQDVTKAKQRVAQTFRRFLQSEADLKILADVHLEHKMLSGERACALLNHRCILAYNGEGWYDIHPLLET